MSLSGINFSARSSDEIALAKAIEDEKFPKAEQLLGRHVKFVDPGDRIFFKLYREFKFHSLHFLFKNNLCGSLSLNKRQVLWVAGCATMSQRIAQQLLGQGLDPALPPLLSSAIFFERGDLVEILMRKGATLDRPNDPPYLECNSGDMGIWLIGQYGADPFAANQTGEVLCQIKGALNQDFVLLWQSKTEGKEFETALSKKYMGRFKHFLWTEEDFTALEDYRKQRPCNLLELAFLLGNSPLVKELKARYPEHIDRWLKDLTAQYSEKSCASLRAIFEIS